MAKDTYCGIDKVPNGKKLGTAKECAESRQVRYYGKEKIDPKLLVYNKRGVSYENARDKLRVLQWDARKLVKDYQEQERLSKAENLRPAQKKQIQLKLDKYLKKREVLLKKINSTTKNSSTSTRK